MIRVESTEVVENFYDVENAWRLISVNRLVN